MKGFTLIELLVVIAIAGIMLAMAVNIVFSVGSPSVGSSKWISNCERGMDISENCKHYLRVNGRL